MSIAYKALRDIVSISVKMELKEKYYVFLQKLVVKIVKEKVGVYMRVSTKNQDTQMQKFKLKEWIKNHKNVYEVYKVYEDKGTGKDDKRPEYRQLLKDVSMRRFDVFVIYKLDRVFRSTAHFSSFFQLLMTKQIGFISATENFDTTNIYGKFQIDVMAAIAELERGMISQRVRDGKAASKIKQGRKELKKPTHKIMRLKQQGMSIRDISKEVGLSVGTIHSVIKKCSKIPTTKNQ